MRPRLMLTRFFALFRKKAMDRELEDEILAHLELAENEGIAAGLSAEEARARARRHFGAIASMREEHRDQRGFTWMENLWRDLRYGFAGLAREPGFAAIVCALLALGIGANTAMFSILDAVLLRPLPFPKPERMVRVWESPTPATRNGTTTLTFLDWKRQSDVFEALSVESPVRATAEVAGDPVRLSGELVSADFFKVFGIQPQIGRSFFAGEDQPGAPAVVVISNSLWQSRFGGDAKALGSDLRLDGTPHRIIGVMPAGSFDRSEAVFWKPLIFAPEQLNRGQHMFLVVGRLRPKVSLAQAQAKMNLLRTSLKGELAGYPGWGFAVDPFQRFLVGDSLRRSLYLVFGAVLMVLLIACANVANLMLAKGAARTKEFALRAALGAGRGRLMAQLLAECLVLCLLGGAAGVAMAYLLLHALTPLVAPLLPFTADVSLNLRVLGFAAAVGIVVLLLAGLLPSLKTSGHKLSYSLNLESRGTSSSRTALRRSIVVAEVALSVVLLCGAALLFKSLLRLQEVDTGIRIDHVITASADLPAAAYPTPASATHFYEAAVQRLQTLPGVEQASLTETLPLEGAAWGEGMHVAGSPGVFNVGLKPVDSSYFATMGIRVLSGRGIAERDQAGAPRVVVVNQELAQELSRKIGTANPVGRIVGMELPGYGLIPESLAPVQIVGVIHSERTEELQSPQRNVAYIPLAQLPQRDINLVVRTQMDPAALISNIRGAIKEVDPNLALGNIRTMEEVKAQSLLWAKQPTWVIGAFAGVAALLAALGLYGVLSHAVTQQRREIGIRMALGARERDVIGHVLRSAVLMLTTGFVVGLAAALALMRLLKSVLFHVSAFDPLVLGAACVVMIFIGMVAAWIPAARAARVDPTVALREEC